MLIIIHQQLIFGAKTSLVGTYLLCCCLRFILTLLDLKHQARWQQIVDFIKNELVNLILIGSCIAIDQLLVDLHIEWKWSIAVMVTGLTIVDQLSFVVNQLPVTNSSYFVRQVIQQIEQLLTKSSK